MSETPILLCTHTLRLVAFEYPPETLGEAFVHFAEVARTTRPVKPDDVGSLTGDAAVCFARICGCQASEGGASCQA